VTDRRRVTTLLLDLIRTVIAVVVGVVLVLVLLFVVSSGPTDQELYDRQEQMMDQIQFLTCINLLTPFQRSPEAVAACQVAPDAEGEQ
jgi:hypothetical protein